MNESGRLLQMTPGRAVFTVAWPMVWQGFARSLFLLVDIWWIGRISDDALAAIGAASFGWWILESFTELPATGTHALVAQAAGAQDGTRLSRWMARGLWTGALVSLVLILLAAVAARAYGAAMGIAGELHGELAMAWIRTAAWVSPGVVALSVVSGILRGLGSTKVTLWITALVFALNAALDPLFIWGLGSWQGMGMIGTAVATSLASLIGAGCGAVWLSRRNLKPAVLGPRIADMAQVARVGAPIAVTGVGFALVYVVLARMVADFGPQHLAALGVGHRVEGFTYLAATGLAVGVSTMVGQHLGAGDRDAVGQVTRAGRALTVTAMVLIGVPVALAAPTLFGFFSGEADMVDAGVIYLRIQAAAWVFMGLELIYEGAFTGAARTLPALVISASLTLMRLPLAWLLAYHTSLGVLGIWIAISLSTAAKGIVLGWWFQRRTLPTLAVLPSRSL